MLSWGWLRLHGLRVGPTLNYNGLRSDTSHGSILKDSRPTPTPSPPAPAPRPPAPTSSSVLSSSRKKKKNLLFGSVGGQLTDWALPSGNFCPWTQSNSATAAKLHCFSLFIGAKLSPPERNSCCCRPKERMMLHLISHRPQNSPPKNKTKPRRRK